MNCVQCASDLTKYTCPKCEVKTCSLVCSKQHKVDRDCDGIRSTVPKFVPILGYSAFSDRLSVEDQHFMSTIHHRAHASSSLRGLKRSRPNQPQSEIYERLAVADGGEPTADVENGVETDGPPTKKVAPAAAQAQAKTVADDFVAESEEAVASKELSGSNARQSVLASARKRRIWLNPDNVDKDCGKTRYDKFAETMLWTVGVRFLYTKPATSAEDKVSGEEPATNELANGESAIVERTAVEDGEVVDDTISLLNGASVDVEAFKGIAADVENEKLAADEKASEEVEQAKPVESKPIDSADEKASEEVEQAKPVESKPIDSADEKVSEEAEQTKPAESKPADSADENASEEAEFTKPADSKPIDSADETATLMIEDAEPTKTDATSRGEEEEQLYTVHNIPESLTVFTLVRQFVRPKVHGPLVSRADLDMTKMTPFVEAAERPNGLMIYMRVPYCDEERYYVVDPTSKLLDNLRNRFVDGYPTLIVTISDQYTDFHVLSEPEARAIFDRLRPSMENRESVQRQHYGHGHANNNNRRFPYNDKNRQYNNNNNNYGRNGSRPFQNNTNNSNNNNGRGPPRNFNNNGFSHNNNNVGRQGYNNYRHNSNSHNNPRGFSNRQRVPVGDNLERFLDDPRLNS